MDDLIYDLMEDSQFVDIITYDILDEGEQADAYRARKEKEAKEKEEANREDQRKAIYRANTRSEEFAHKRHDRNSSSTDKEKEAREKERQRFRQHTNDDDLDYRDRKSGSIEDSRVRQYSHKRYEDNNLMTRHELDVAYDASRRKARHENNRYK